MNDQISKNQELALDSAVQLLNDKSSRRALEVALECMPENTKRAHEGDIEYWVAWLNAIGYSINKPLTKETIVSFVIQHVEGLDESVDEQLINQGCKNKKGTHKLATIKRRIASLSKFLSFYKRQNPCNDPEVKVLLKSYTKKYSGSEPARKAITKDILDDMLETCGNKLIDIRDKALLLFAWSSGGRRRAEVTSADMKDLIKAPEDYFIYTIPKSKTDQEGIGYPVPVKGRAAKALIDWFTASLVSDGAIFRAVSKDDAIGKALSDIDVNRIVKKRLKKAGYDESQFGAHS